MTYVEPKSAPERVTWTSKLRRSPGASFSGSCPPSTASESSTGATGSMRSIVASMLETFCTVTPRVARLDRAISADPSGAPDSTRDGAGGSTMLIE